MSGRRSELTVLTIVVVGQGNVDRSNGRTAAVAVRICVRALVRRPLEERVLERVVRRDPRLRIVVEHSQDKVLEFEVFGHRMAGLARPPTARPTSLDAQYVVETPRARDLVSLAVLCLFQRVPAGINNMFI